MSIIYLSIYLSRATPETKEDPGACIYAEVGEGAGYLSTFSGAGHSSSPYSGAGHSTPYSGVGHGPPYSGDQFPYQVNQGRKSVKIFKKLQKKKNENL